MEPLLDAQDVKKLLNVALATVYKMAERGQLPCVKWVIDASGKRPKSVIRFKKEELSEGV